MAPALELSTEAGWATLALGGVSKAIDIFKLWSQLDQIREQTEAEPQAEFSRRVVSLLVGYGFPRVSHLVALEVVKWHAGQMAALQDAEESPAAP